MHRYRRHFQADVAAADDGHATAGLERLFDGVHVGDGTQVMHARQVAARRGQATRPRPGSQQQFVVRERLAVGANHALGLSVDFLHARVVQGDVLAFVELGRAQMHLFQAVLASQILLGEGRPLIGKVRLFAKNENLALVARLPQTRSPLSGGMTAADDDHAHALDSLDGLQEA